jgi:hypothetical protein
MSDDPPPTPPSTPTNVFYDSGIQFGTGERFMPTRDELRAMKDREVVARINGLFESVETGRTSIQDGADKVAVIAKAQYFTQELERRSQDRQTWAIIAMTAAIVIMTAVITAMTAVIMVQTIWPDWIQSISH